MEMEDGLAGAGAIVEDGAIAVEKIAFSGELCGDQMQLADDRLIFMRRVVQGNKMFSGDKQDMCGRLGADVLERENIWIFVNDF